MHIDIHQIYYYFPLNLSQSLTKTNTSHMLNNNGTKLFNMLEKMYAKKITLVDFHKK